MPRKVHKRETASARRHAPDEPIEAMAAMAVDLDLDDARDATIEAAIHAIAVAAPVLPVLAAFLIVRAHRIHAFVDEQITIWAELLKQMIQHRARDLELAELRDRHAAAGFDPRERTSARTPSDAAVAPVTVELFPISPAAESARASGALKRRGYSDRGVLEPVSWRWLAFAQRHFSNAQLARAYELGTGYTRHGKTARSDGQHAISVMRSEMKAAANKRVP